VAAVRALMERYANVPMSLADAAWFGWPEITGLRFGTIDSDCHLSREWAPAR